MAGSTSILSRLPRNCSANVTTSIFVSELQPAYLVKAYIYVSLIGTITSIQESMHNAMGSSGGGHAGCSLHSLSTSFPHYSDLRLHLVFCRVLSGSLMQNIKMECFTHLRLHVYAFMCFISNFDDRLFDLPIKEEKN